MAAATKSSQQIIDDFWKTSISTDNLSKASCVLPPNVYAELVKSQVPRGTTAAQSVEASYELAKKDCETKVAQIVKECRMVNQKYSDPYFDLSDRDECLKPLRAKPKQDSNAIADATFSVTQNGQDAGNLTLFNQPVQSDDDSSPSYPPSVKRVGDIFDTPQFFVDGANAKDIRQGREGDCWFLSALSTLANLEPTQHLINRVCVARDEEVGVYGFVLFRDGEWTSVIIDDKLFLREPDYEFTDSSTRHAWEENRVRVNSEEEYRKEFQSNSRSLYYAQSADSNETWVPLIEKAFAKAHGDYGAISGGSVGEGVEDLTGGLSTTLFPTDILSKDRFWKECLMKVNEEFLFGCGTPNWDDWSGQGRDGIHGGHAYSVLRAVEYNKERLLLMKNPWGEREWNGPWSDGSSQWTPDSIKALGHTFGDDGIFWIRYEDMLRKYDVIWRTRLFTPEWKVTQQWTNLPIHWAGEYCDTKFEFTISKTTPTAIVLSKLDDRYFQGLTGQYEFVPSFRVHKAGEEDYIMRTFGGEIWDRSVSVDLTLEPGTYEVRLKITATRDDNADKVEDVIKDNWLDRRDKLLQIGQSYDLAHAKAQVEEPEKPKASEAQTTQTEGDTVPDTPDTPKTDAVDKPTTSDGPEARGAAPYEDDTDPAPDKAADAKPDDKKEDDKPDAPWSAIAVVGLRVYCKEGDATIKIIRPKPPVEEVKAVKLDVDDPARDAAKGVKEKEKEKEQVTLKDGDDKKEGEKKGEEVKVDEEKTGDKKEVKVAEEQSTEKTEEVFEDAKEEEDKDQTAVLAS